MDDYEKALNGDGQGYPGFLKIADEYGSTDAGNLAELYAGLSYAQTGKYQEAVIPTGAKVFGLTAGLPVTLEGLVGPCGKIWGLNSFGYSAPYKVLDEKLGFTAENVYAQVKSMF